MEFIRAVRQRHNTGTTTIPANATDNLNARTRGDPNDTADPTYGETSLYLYTHLSGDSTWKP